MKRKPKNKVMLFLTQMMIIEASIAIGALFGVLMLKPAWLLSMGLFNVFFCLCLGLLPACFIAMISIKFPAETQKKIIVLSCLFLFIFTAYLSYIFSVAQIGI